MSRSTFSFYDRDLRIYTCEAGIMCSLCSVFGGRNVYLCDFRMLRRHLEVHRDIDPLSVPDRVWEYVLDEAQAEIEGYISNEELRELYG